MLNYLISALRTVKAHVSPNFARSPYIRHVELSSAYTAGHHDKHSQEERESSPQGELRFLVTRILDNRG